MRLLILLLSLQICLSASAGWVKLSEQERAEVVTSLHNQVRAQNFKIGSNCDSTWGSIYPLGRAGEGVSYERTKFAYRNNSQPMLFFSTFPMGANYQQDTSLGYSAFVYVYTDARDEAIVSAVGEIWQPVKTKTGTTSNPQYKVIMQKTLSMNCR